MATKDSLDFSGFFEVTPLRLDGDVMDMLKHLDSRGDVRDFLKDCPVEEFIYILVKLFKDTYPDTGGFGYYIGEKQRELRERQLKTTWHTPKYRKDIEEIIYVYDTEDPLVNYEFHLISMELKFRILLNTDKVKKEIKEALGGKQYEQDGNKFTVQDSAIEYLEVSENKFFLKVNESKKVYY